MTCLHCRVTIHVQWTITRLSVSHLDKASKAPFGWETRYATCPACSAPIINLETGKIVNHAPGVNISSLANPNTYVVWPRSGERPCPEEVPPEIAEDFREAAAVLAISPKASAALSRRCLQQVLVQYQGAEGRDLQKQIDDFIIKKSPPKYISDQLHVIRQIGNFAAHTQKDTATGEILPVEAGEAEWNLDVLESLFDFVFVQPIVAQRKIDNLNAKLQAVGKPKIG